MKRRGFTATTLRLTLSLSLLLITLLAIGGFYMTNGWLKSFATEVSHASADAQASHTTITTLQQLQERLADNREVIQRASNIVAESQSYQYQDEIIRDINNYASAAGVGITNYNFDTQASPNQGQSGAESAPAPEATPTPTPAAPAGINSTHVSISLQNPVNYDNLLRFFHSIEQNLTKMQVTNISLAKDEGIDVTSEDLVIEVYIR